MREMDLESLQWIDKNNIETRFIDLKPGQLGDKSLSN
jgi:hypothetical protein